MTWGDIGRAKFDYVTVYVLSVQCILILDPTLMKDPRGDDVDFWLGYILFDVAFSRGILVSHLHHSIPLG